MLKKNVSLDSPIEEKVSWAEACFKAIGPELREDRVVSALLSEMKNAVAGSRRAMAATGLIEICRECEENEGGSCCGADLENRYDGLLLLINLLLGAELPKGRRDEKSCFFLGDRGCGLSARHVICVNYLCKKAADRTAPEEIMALRAREGVELETLFRLHERVRNAVSEAAGRSVLMDGRLRESLLRVARFYDRRKVGHVGALGFRRSTDLEVLLSCLERLVEEGVVLKGKTRFLDLGCADGRVNVLMSYLARVSAGVELDEWTLDESAPLRSQLSRELENEALLQPPENVFLVQGDSMDEDVHQEVKNRSGTAFEEFDLFYTYLVMHEEFASLILAKAKRGAYFLVYGLDKILPRYEGLRLLDHISPLEGILAVYQKE